MKHIGSLLVKVLCIMGLVLGANGIVNQKVTRAFDMNGPNTRQVTSIEFNNEAAPGESSKQADAQFYVALVRSDVKDTLIYIEAKMGKDVLDVARSEQDDPEGGEYEAYRINFSSALSSGKLTVIEEYTGRKVPFPKKMKIKDDPQIMVIDDGYYPTIYFTKKMKSTFEVGNSATVISATEIESGEVRGRSVRYGTYKNIEALTSHPVIIQMHYNDPLPVFSSVKRKVTVSHWSRIKVDEEYRLENRISTLEGEFGRIDFNEFKVKYAINNFDCELPQDTEDLYYSDEIGNITTSHAYRNNKHVKFLAEPRFPLMGGWKTFWSQGYTLPYVTHQDSDTYKFEINFSHPYNDIVAENFEFTIVLPEGADIIDVRENSSSSGPNSVGLDLPFEMDSIKKDTVFEYLDLRGRTAIIMSKTNVIEKYHDLKVSVTYKLSAFDIYFKPALVCLYIFVAIFFSMMIYRLSSLSNSKVKSE